MADETIVAVFDSAAEAETAVRELESAGVPSSGITRHETGADVAGGVRNPASAQRDRGFWSTLFGGEPEHDTMLYDRSIESGSTVVSVRTPGTHIRTVMDILEKHNPVDLKERAGQYGVGYTGTSAFGGTGAGATASATGTVAERPLTGARRETSETAAASRQLAGDTTRDTTRREAERLTLAEEQLQVGKRVVNRGTTRIHRFVEETPVEENVTLRDEVVSIDRRPVTGTREASDADFADKTIEVTETREEPVVAKTARVREEVLISKAARERTETVRDTVRREDVRVEKDDEVQEPGRTTDRRPGV